MKKYLSAFFAVYCFSIIAFAQIPTATLVNIVKAEDERRYDATLENLLKNQDAKIRVRASLAAGRIGDERAVLPLVELLEKDSSVEVRTMALFALGEIESLKGADAIVKVLADTKTDGSLRARAIEAAGKIAAANAKDEPSKVLGEAILDALDYEDKRRSKPNTEAILLGLTAVLRARPEEGDFVAAKFLTYMNARIRSDAANTLSRLRAKNANEQLRAMLLSDDDANARANAARALGAAEDKAAFDALLEAALTDEDSRVRVSAIRSLGSLKDQRAADKLTERGATLLADYKKSKSANPSEKSELLEIATTLGRILPNSDDEKAIKFLTDFGLNENFISSEIHISIAKISPSKFLELTTPNNICNVNSINLFTLCWQFYSSFAQGLSEIANLDEKNPLRSKAEEMLVAQLEFQAKSEFGIHFDVRSISDKLRAFSKFKSKKTNEVFKNYLINYKDVIVRATAAELLGEQPSTKENVEVLKTVFIESLKEDEKYVLNLKKDKNDYNDAQLAILSALVKLDKQQAIESLKLALAAPDYLVRRHAAQLIKENDLRKNFPNAEANVGTVKTYNPQTKTKLGQILNTNADYVRAVSRKSARAILTTEKGVFTIEFTPEDAPLTVDNFIKLAKANYFNGLAIHRVVPNFVMQDGDPRGDGNGGPGFSIRCEVNLLSYERGAVGMALSGKDTGGSQWFVTHSPQPHLDGGYTVFGRVNETDMKIVDNLVRGDKIISVKIIEGGQLSKSKRRVR
jgi:cyclophilin family peptidyl-prolyl cis-trans isomerase/HEAT repeat protein